MKTKLISIVMVVLLVAALGINAFAESNIGVQPGQAMPDFTVSLTDGTTATLSDLLKEKDLVVLNIFASWCGPCEKEFPEMEEAYKANSEKMVIVSVSGDPNDTMETISAYKANHNLTFPMGLAGDGLSFLSVPGFPTTLFIDRNGNVGFIKVGAFVDKGEFEGKVSTFLSPDYDGKPLASEEAVSFTPYFMGASVLGILLLIVGRWLLFRKAGKKGWHSLIPFLNSFEEYSLCWNGWLGVLADVIAVAGFWIITPVPHYLLMGAGLALGIVESVRLAKAFGKSTVLGVLMGLPVIRGIGRIVLGASKAAYTGAAKA